MKPKLFFMLALLPLIYAGCIIECMPPEFEQSKSYPLWFSFKNETDKKLSVKLITGIVPSHTASYKDFTPIPQKYFDYISDNRWKTQAAAELAAGSYGAAAMRLKLSSLMHFTDRDLQDSPELKDYVSFMRNKLITCIIEISDDPENTVRIAGWQLPETDKVPNNIIATGWALWDTSDWGTEETHGHDPRLYISNNSLRPYKWNPYPYYSTVYLVKVSDLSASGISCERIQSDYGIYSSAESDAQTVWNELLK